MAVIDMQSLRKLRELRAKVEEFQRAIDAFEGEVMELGELRAKHYASQYRADELQRVIKTGGDHES